MTAPGIDYYKFYILDPEEGENLILNPQPYVNTDYYGFSGSTDVVVDDTYTRRGPACLKMNPVASTDCFVATWNLGFTSGTSYTFSVDVLATEGETLKLYFATTDAAQVATKSFTATGYWQRPSLTYSSTSTAEYWAGVQKDASTNTDGVWMDGWQVEASTSATSFIWGYEPGLGYMGDDREYWWTGLSRHSSSKRSEFTRHGGRIVDIEDYAAILGVFGLGMGTFEQIMTPMVSGGAFYQKHIRKPRNFGLRLQYTGTGLEEIQAKRAALLDMLRPDATPYDQPLVIRYQGFDVNGNEATHPVDIACVLQNCHTDPPNSPTHQEDILMFTVMDGHLSGGYWEGKTLDLYADFPAEFIVKRDAEGNWCSPTTDGGYASLITGLNGGVLCMAEAPDGKIYVGGSFTDAGGVSGASKLARWNPINEKWEKVVVGISGTIYAMDFDANGDLYIGGSFTGLGTTDGNYIAKLTDLDGTPAISPLGTGTSHRVAAILVNPKNEVFVGGDFTSAGGVADTKYIARWSGTNWYALDSGLNNSVNALALSANGLLYIGGLFTNADGTYGDYICYWNNLVFSRVGTVELTGSGLPYVSALAFDNEGYLAVGGNFTNAGGNANADYIARWEGRTWEVYGTGVNGIVSKLFFNSGKLYATGSFTTAGGLTLTDRVAVWSNGAWKPIDIDLPGTERVNSILPASDGSLYIGGTFSTLAEDPDENAKTGVVALNLNVTSASANVYPFVQIHGPGELRGITNYSTNRSITFDGLTLLSGEHVNLYLDPVDLKMESSWSGRGSVLRYVNAGSDFGDFYLKPGENLISLFLPSTDSNSGGWLKWKPKFWSIEGAKYE